jgi:hypothetical protein
MYYITINVQYVRYNTGRKIKYFIVYRLSLSLVLFLNVYSKLIFFFFHYFRVRSRNTTLCKYISKNEKLILLLSSRTRFINQQALRISLLLFSIFCRGSPRSQPPLSSYTRGVQGEESPLPGGGARYSGDLRFLF